VTIAVSHDDRLNGTSEPASAGSGARVWPRASTVGVLVWLALFGAELVAIVTLCDFNLVFSLDDPYIHLAVADQILSGGYGVNAGEYSSPSSAIVWPYLLLPLEMLHLGAFGPLLINAAVACATVFAILRLVETSGLFDGAGERSFAYLIAFIVIFNASAIALPMTGMEHSLHVLASVVTFTGLVAAARGGSPTPLHFVALASLPFIRFEGAALACSAVAGFALLGQRRFAAGAALAIAMGVAVYAALMVSRGLPLIPSSVMMKAQLAADANKHAHTIVGTILSVIQAITTAYGLRLLMLGVALAVTCFWLRSDRKALIVCLVALAAVGAHLAVGQYGWFNRYEVYIMTLAATALLWAVAHTRPKLAARQWNFARAALVLLLGVAALPYATIAMVTPFGSRGIYEQQYQMARFAQSFHRHPVAVNDLGLVAYKNKNYVLDLWGLGSEEVRKAKRAGQYGPEMMGALASDHDVGLVMIYDAWFPKGVPSSWTKVAVLRSQAVTADEPDVSFYRTPSGNAAELASALQAFKTTLPPRVTLEIMAP
jgi:hypothetical protein